MKSTPISTESEQIPDALPSGMQAEDIDRLPALPGIYIMKDAAGKAIYIGKAADLRSRVRSYFTRAGDARFNVRFLMRYVRSVETIITSTETEAFLLEDTLIKKEQPKYNIRLRDDKTYVSVRFNMDHEWPRAVVMRRRHERKDGGLYLGPFSSAHSTRATLRMLQKVFPIRSCPDSVLRNRTRPCLLHPIGRCAAPCVKPVEKKDYDEWIQGTILVLKGKTEEVLAKLRGEMAKCSERMEFERAAAIRDRIAAIESTGESQRVHKHEGGDRDVVVCERSGGRLGFALFSYRNGILVRSRPYIFKDLGRELGEVMAEFLARYYGNETPPAEILLHPEPSDSAALAQWLGVRREGTCHLISPQRGEKVRLIEIARENCTRWIEQHVGGQTTREEIGRELMEKFQLDEAPDAIECYDISTLQGFATVGSQVAFREGQPDKARYRRYRIKTLDGQDDFGALREMLTRRFRKVVEGTDPPPDLVMIDGGKGQLNVACAVFEELGVTGVGLVSIAKSRVKHRGDKTERTEERFFLPGRKNPVTFAANSPTLYLLQQVRDEAHRFGITYHRDLRKKRNLRSALEDLPGVGKIRAATLLRAFGSMRALREATEEQIAATKGIPAHVATTVHKFLHEA